MVVLIELQAPHLTWPFLTGVCTELSTHIWSGPSGHCWTSTKLAELRDKTCCKCQSIFLSRAQHSHVETQKHPSRSKRPCCFDREKGRNSIATMKSSATLHVFRMAEPQSNAESRKLCRCETACPCASMKPRKPYRLLRACLVIRIHWKPPIHRSVIRNRNTEGVLQIKRVLLIN